MTSADNIAETVRLFLRAVERQRLPISGDLRVREGDAAALLGISESGLRALRSTGDGPKAVSIGVAGSRLSYSVVELAKWIEQRRER